MTTLSLQDNGRGALQSLRKFNTTGSPKNFISIKHNKIKIIITYAITSFGSVLKEEVHNIGEVNSLTNGLSNING